jgi:hypothetical protein
VIVRLGLIAGFRNGLSRMSGNHHVRFLGEDAVERPHPYPTDHNHTKISNVVKKGDFESLAAWLKKGKVEEADIVELKQAISTDNELGQGEYGERVKAWMRKMTGKAIDGSWNIGIGAAGTLLAEGLKAFFGR